MATKSALAEIRLAAKREALESLVPVLQGERPRLSAALQTHGVGESRLEQKRNDANGKSLLHDAAAIEATRSQARAAAAEQEAAVLLEEEASLHAQREQLEAELKTRYEATAEAEKQLIAACSDAELIEADFEFRESMVRAEKRTLREQEAALLSVLRDLASQRVLVEQELSDALAYEQGGGFVGSDGDRSAEEILASQRSRRGILENELGTAARLLDASRAAARAAADERARAEAAHGRQLLLCEDTLRAAQAYGGQPAAQAYGGQPAAPLHDGARERDSALLRPREAGETQASGGNPAPPGDRSFPVRFQERDSAHLRLREETRREAQALGRQPTPPGETRRGGVSPEGLIRERDSALLRLRERTHRETQAFGRNPTPARDTRRGVSPERLTQERDSAHLHRREGTHHETQAFGGNPTPAGETRRGVSPERLIQERDSALLQLRTLREETRVAAPDGGVLRRAREAVERPNTTTATTSTTTTGIAELRARVCGQGNWPRACPSPAGDRAAFGLASSSLRSATMAAVGRYKPADLVSPSPVVVRGGGGGAASGRSFHSIVSPAPGGGASNQLVSPSPFAGGRSETLTASPPYGKAPGLAGSNNTGTNHNYNTPSVARDLFSAVSMGTGRMWSMDADHLLSPPPLTPFDRRHRSRAPLCA
eukprot:gene2371-3675_t